MFLRRARTEFPAVPLADADVGVCSPRLRVMLIAGIAAFAFALVLLAAAVVLFTYHRVSEGEYRRIKTSSVSHYGPARHLQLGRGTVTIATRGGLHGLSVMLFAREWAYVYCGRTGRGGILNHFGRKPSPGGYVRIDVTGLDFTTAVPREDLRMRRWDSAVATRRAYTGPGTATAVASPRVDRKVNNARAAEATDRSLIEEPAEMRGDTIGG